MMQKILYLSCHSILEYLEVKLFNSMGYDIFSLGAYTDPKGCDGMRPPIDNLVYDQDILDQWGRLCSNHPGEDGRGYLTKEFVDNFDIVIVMHLPNWIINNWEVLKHKRVIWRTIGQSVDFVENMMKPYREQGLEIVRYSPMENNIPGFIGSDALIRFNMDENDYKIWEGSNKRVITFCQSMRQRGDACNFKVFEEVTKVFPRHLFGPQNEGLDWSSGKITPEQQLEEYKLNRVYFYTGTHPASYTLNFMEASMAGMPIVAIGPFYGNSLNHKNHHLYEIPMFIENEYNGFISDNVYQLRSYIKELLVNDNLAKIMSTRIRNLALSLFSNSVISKQWKQYLG